MEREEDDAIEVTPTPQQDIKIFAEDNVKVSELLSLEVYEAGVIHGARRVDEVISSAGDHQAHGIVQDTLLGTMHQGEDNTKNVAWTLITRLNQDGTHWGEPQLSEDEYWVDWVARDGEKILKIQVTRIGASHFYHDFSKSKRATTPSTADEAADRLKDAIEEKRKKYEKQKLSSARRGELTLALDAVAFLSHSFDPVIHAFRRQHGAWACQLGFIAIWIVGMSISTTHRLDLA